MLVDAHIHIPACLDHSFSLSPNSLYLSSSASLEEFDAHNSLKPHNNTLLSAGIHPWYLDRLDCETIESWALKGKIHAIGECGIDLYTPELAKNKNRQKELFANQIAIAKSYHLPLVIHERKGLNEILQFSKELSQLPGVIFHSWNNSPEQIGRILHKNINAFFSVGTTTLRNSKKSKKNISAIPLNHLLSETDAPFQPPRYESLTHPGILSAIVGMISTIKKSQRKTIEAQIARNFTNLLIKN